MRIRWFVERKEDEESNWGFLDGDVPLIREHVSPLIYKGHDEKVLRALGLAELRTDRIGLPLDASPIPRACAQVQRRVAHHHSWRTIEELLDCETEDSDFLNVVAAMLEVRAERVIYWFED